MRFATERTTRSPHSSEYGIAGMSVMWMPPSTSVPPLASAASASGTSGPTGAKMMAPSSGFGGGSLGRAGPAGAELAGEPLRRRVARAREGIDLLAVKDGELGDDVRGGAEAVDAEALRASLTSFHAR